MMPGKTTCKHERFAASVDVSRLSETESGPITGYTADVRIKCAECGLRFRFVGIECGNSLFAPKVSVDATELRAPIEPAYVQEILGVPSVAGNA